METTARLVLMSDLHDCHIDWYGVPTAERMERLVRQYRAYAAACPVDHIMMLGDYSLDFWQWDVKGSWLREGVSNTRHFVRTYADRLGTPYTMIPGNHEQYGEALFYEMTGCHRRASLSVGGAAFILADSFGRDLDPREHSDGTYAPMDVAWIRAEMDRYPGQRVFLCAHFFDLERESEAFARLVREEDRIVGLFQGHTHRCDVVPLGPAYGDKPLVQTGQFSYSHATGHPGNGFWGWRELILTPTGAVTHYYTPANDCVIDGAVYHHAAGRQDAFTWRF